MVLLLQVSHFLPVMHVSFSSSYHAFFSCLLSRLDLPVFLQCYISNVLYAAGVLTDPLAPSSFGGWLSHAANEHVGAIAFIVSDIFLFSGVAILTAVQASQVSLLSSNVCRRPCRRR